MIHQKVVVGKKYDHHYYFDKIGALYIDNFTYNDKGFIKEWKFTFDDTINTGDRIEDFIILLNEIVKEYNLNDGTVIIIYTKDLDKAYGFLHNYDENITRFEDYYFMFNNHFQIRNIEAFYNNIDYNDIYDKGQELYDEIFIPCDKTFLTPTQYMLDSIKNGCDTDIAKDLFPYTREAYNTLLKSYFGGLCVCKYPTVCIEQELDQFDRDSAYIFELLCQKHLSEPLKVVNPLGLEYYLDFENEYYALMIINIEFSKLGKGMDLYKDINGDRIIDTDKPYKMVINNTDFLTIQELATIKKYTCIHLEVGKKDYLPSYITDKVYTEYIKKREYKKSHDARLLMQKKLINSVYGAMVKRIRSFKKEKEKAFLTPHWGILIASYARRSLLKAALQVEKWIYSDTDSIYALSTEKNHTIYMYINDEFRQKTYIMCLEKGYDFDKIKNLGCFEYKNTYVKFQANGKKQYMYTDINGVFKVVASGCTGENDENAYNFYVDDFGNNKSCIDMGIKVYGHIKDDVAKEVINGKLYESNGYYYETYSSSEKKFMCHSYMKSLFEERR